MNTNFSKIEAVMINNVITIPTCDHEVGNKECICDINANNCPVKKGGKVILTKTTSVSACCSFLSTFHQK